MASPPNHTPTQDKAPTQDHVPAQDQVSAKDQALVRNPAAPEPSTDNSGLTVQKKSPDAGSSGSGSGTNTTRDSGNPGASKIHTRANISADRAHDGNTVEDRGQQVNGDYKPPPNAPQHGGIWSNNGAKGDGQQINGNFHGDDFFRKTIGNNDKQ